MNSISPTSKKPGSRRSISRPSHFFTTPRRCIINLRINQLHYNSNQYTMKRTSTRTNPSICMSSSNYSSSTIIITSSSSRSYHYIINRPKPKHILLRPCRRGRPSTISTLILILWAPRSIYFNFTRIRINFTHRSTLYSKTRTIRNPRNNLRYTRNCSSGVYCMSSPHIHSRTRRRYTSILHSSNNNYCCTNRN